MRRLTACLLLLASPALAEDAPPFVPYTVDQQSHVAMMNFLQDVPARYALPLMQTLSGLQQKAVDGAKKAATDKPAKK